MRTERWADLGTMVNCEFIAWVITTNFMLHLHKAKEKDYVSDNCKSKRKKCLPELSEGFVSKVLANINLESRQVYVHGLKQIGL